ncbi:MAG: fumarylacetoacetate hydrolase family protein [Caldilineaceae bacterium]|nr:fumarylacetoacetate hydrolase family protein [Caldilineaceae bacterium]MDE0464531.1 fumarylacetoacetate hydrolase family protein [Caldilineaceae bacterium]
MKLATYVGSAGVRVGVVDGDHIYDIRGAMEACGLGDPATVADMVTLLGAGEPAMEGVRAALEWAKNKNGPELTIPLHGVTLRAPLPSPGKLMCLAGNYASHIEEGGGSYIGKEKMIPRFFIKPTSSVTATKQPIRIPASTGFADWELELAVVVGKTGRDLTPEEAEEHIMGYTIFNDISARELTFRNELPEQEGDWYFDWLVGKWLDTFGPMGPWITTRDEIAHPDRLRMRLWQNDTLHQDASTGQMIFSPAEALSFVSQFVTLEPGDLLSTGTPSGVGHAKKVRLEPGDRIRGEIEGLGVLENTVEAL